MLSALSVVRASQPVESTLARFFSPLGLDVVIFALLFRFVPRRGASTWDAVVACRRSSAESAGKLAKSAFGWYLLNVANYQFVYGTLSTGIVLLFWAYVIALDLFAERRILRAV